MMILTDLLMIKNRFSRDFLNSHFISSVFFLFEQLRETIFAFTQKELAPYANDIDKNNTFPQLRVSFKPRDFRPGK